MRRTTSRSRPLRVFVGLTEVAGYFTKVASALVDAGCSVTVLVLDDPFRYAGADERFVRPPAFASTLLVRSTKDRGIVARSSGIFGRAILLAWTMWRCDGYVFASGATFFRGLDLTLLKLARKRTVAVFMGSDVRPPYISGIEWIRETGDPDLASINRVSRRTSARVRRVEGGVGAIISHPAYSQFQRKPFYAHLAIGLPIPRLPPRGPAAGGGVPVVLHAPTRPLHKGTPEIEATLENLRSERVQFEYRVLMNLPNAEVLRELRSSDVVVDEVHGDTLLGSLGVEAAAAGCAVVVAGYAGDVIARFHTCPLPPVELIEPANLSSELRRRLSDVDELRADGAALRAFVEREWDPGAVGERIVTVLNGTADPAWLIDPLEVVYVEGWGIDRDVLRRCIATYIAAFGPAGLYLDHHGPLRSAFTEFASS